MPGPDALPPADRRSAFTNAPMGIALTTPDGILVDANPALCALLGVTADELYGQSVLDLAHPEGLGRRADAYAALTAQPEPAHAGGDPAACGPTAPTSRCRSRPRGWRRRPTPRPTW